MPTTTVSTEKELSFRFEGLYFERQSQQLITDRKSLRAGRDQILTWDWRLVSDGAIEVMVGIKVEAATQAPEQLEVILVGRFAKVTGPNDATAFSRFAAINAVAILLPYAREALTSLSSRGPFGPIVLQPVNVVEMAKGFDLANATGAKQSRQKLGTVRHKIGKTTSKRKLLNR